MINTINGKISAEDLGQVLVHEHITCADLSMRANFGKKYFDWDRVVDLAVKQVLDTKACGVSTMVDGTAVNLGRDIDLIKTVADKTGMQFIVSSGFYYQQEAWLSMRTNEYIKDLLVEECLNGINGSDVLPGVMKAGTDAPGFTDYHKLVIGATCEAGVEVKLPIFIHHDCATKCGLDLAEFAISKGYEPGQIIIGHCSDSDDIEYLESILKTGVYIGMDRFGYYPWGVLPMSVERSFKTLLTLLNKGYEKQIMLSTDLAAYLGMLTTLEQDELAYSTKTMPTSTDYTYIHKAVLPFLKENGIGDEVFKQMLVENTKKFLTSFDK